MRKMDPMLALLSAISLARQQMMPKEQAEVRERDSRANEFYQAWLHRPKLTGAQKRRLKKEQSQ